MSKAPRIYSGSCHCGSVEFSFRSAEITSGLRCNCSICIRKGAIMSGDYFPPEAFLFIRGMDALAVYEFGDRTVNHYFCTRCGIYPFHDAKERPGFYRLNLGCVTGLDPLTLDIGLIDGRHF